MADRLDTKTRSKVMSAIRSRNTRFEKRFFALLRRYGVRGFTCHPNEIAGSPDLAFKKARVCVFLDSCFWHGCKRHMRKPTSNRAYWKPKIEGNKRRDRRNRQKLRKSGWSVLTIWEHDLSAAEKVVSRVSRAIR